MEYVHTHDCVEDHPLVPWFAFPSDPMVPEEMVPGEIATGANTFKFAKNGSRGQCRVFWETD